MRRFGFIPMLALVAAACFAPLPALADPPLLASLGAELAVDHLVGVVAQAEAPATALNPDDAAQLVNALVGALGAGHWGLAIAVGFVLLTFLLRRFGAPFIPWLRTRTAGVLVPLVGTVALGIATAMIGGLPITVGFVAQLLLVGLAPIGLFSGSKNIGQDMGVIAAKHVTTKPQALQALDPR